MSEAERDPLDDVTPWVGRTVLYDAEREMGPATVLAVDDTEYAPSAWIKYLADRDRPTYRSVDLSDVEDVETGRGGPRWGSKAR